MSTKQTVEINNYFSEQICSDGNMRLQRCPTIFKMQTAFAKASVNILYQKTGGK